MVGFFFLSCSLSLQCLFDDGLFNQVGNNPSVLNFAPPLIFSSQHSLTVGVADGSNSQSGGFEWLIL